MTNPLHGLFLEWKNNTPSYTILQFHNPNAVKNFYGWRSDEATLADEFFAHDPTGANGTVMCFTRTALGQRVHMLGADLSSVPMSQIDSIKGSLALDFNGWHYSGNVDVAGTKTYQDAAQMVQVALNAHRETLATTRGSYWTEEDIHLTGSIDRAQVLSDTRLKVGGRLFSDGVYPLGPNDQIINSHGIDPNTGLYAYSIFTNTGETAHTAPERMVEKYYLFHPGTVTSGAIAPGEQIRTNGLSIAQGLPPSAVIGGSDKEGWVVNAIPNGLGPNLSFESVPLSVGINWQNKDITDLKGNLTEVELNVSVNGNFGFDNYPGADGKGTVMSPYMTGTAAADLGLSQGEATPPGPGGLHTTMSKFLTDLTNLPGGDFSRLHSLQLNRFYDSLTNWVDLNPGHYLDQKLFSTAPADQGPAAAAAFSDAYSLLHQSPAIETGLNTHDASSPTPYLTTTSTWGRNQT